MMNARDVIHELKRPAFQKETITSTTGKSLEWVEIRIIDTGTGIPETIQNKIFNPFFTIKEVGKGTSQGLAITHDMVVKKHEGQLTFETALGAGTTFMIQLPANWYGYAK